MTVAIEADIAAPAIDLSAPPPQVGVRGVTRIFATSSGAVTALDDVSFAIPPGAFFTLLGPSGCGKTTLLRLVAGFEHADRGNVLLDGRDITGDPPNRRPINIVFQSYALFPHLDVGANIAFGLERRGLRGAAVKARVAEMLALVRLDGMEARRPSQLSGGQQQRVALARALAPAPKLLLLDEPLSALDLKLRRGMQVELKRIQRETGITFLLVTHDQEEALSMSDGLAVMDAGRILQSGSPADIFARPNCRFVAEFMGANVVPGGLVGTATPHAALRPEAVAVTDGGFGLPGRVLDAAYLGARSTCTVALDAGPILIAERDDLPAGLVPGRRVALAWAPGAVVPLER